MARTWCQPFRVGSVGCLLAVMACASGRAPPPQAQQGVLDLRPWSFESNAPLNGEWEMHWSKLLEPADFANPVTSPHFLSLPGIWAGHELDGLTLSGEGYATFRLTVLVPPDPMVYGLKLAAMGTAYRLWVNGKELASNGKVGTSRADMVPRYEPQVVYFHNDAPRLELVLQMSNFRERHGGMWNATVLGRAERINKAREVMVVSEIVVFGIVLIMGLYHLGLFALRRRDKASLFFAGLCLTMGLRALTTGERLLVSAWPGIPFELMAKLEYLTFYIAGPMATLFVAAIFPEDISRRWVRAYLATSALFIAVVLLTPASIFTQTLVAYQVIATVMASYLTFVTVGAIRRKRQGAWLWILGMAVFLGCMVVDILSANQVIDTAPVATAGFITMILSQASVLSVRFNRAFDDVERMSQELTVKNRELERASRMKDEFLASTTHELRTPLNSLINLPQVVLQAFGQHQAVHCEKCQGDFQLEENETFTGSEPCPQCGEVALKPKEVWVFEGDGQACVENLQVAMAAGKRMLNMVNTILDMSKFEAGEAHLRLKPVSIPHVVREIEAVLRPLAMDKGLTLDLQLGPADVLRMADEEKLERVVNNLVANAVKYSPRGGTITITYRTEGSRVFLSVKDTGPGIAPEHHEMIFEKFRQVVTHKYRKQGGTGLGLAICRKVVELHGGRIWVDSALGHGATFHVELTAAPADKQNSGNMVHGGAA